MFWEESLKPTDVTDSQSGNSCLTLLVEKRLDLAAKVLDRCLVAQAPQRDEQDNSNNGSTMVTKSGNHGEQQHCETNTNRRRGSYHPYEEIIIMCGS